MSRWLCGVSRIALAVSLSALPIPVLAADTTIDNGVDAQQIVNAGDNLTITDSGSVSADDDPAIRVNSGAAATTITNSGTIETTDNGAARAIRFVNPNGTYNVTIINNEGAVIQGPGDVIQSQPNIAAGTILIDNAGTIRSTGIDDDNGQGIDLNNVTAGTANITITNRATGLITAADSDAIRPANGITINNYGRIISNFVTGANGDDSGNDGIDFNDDGNGGTVNNFAGGLVSGARHGITAGQPITINNAGEIVGRDGAGINLDNGPGTTAVIVNSGTITGTAVSADGDGIDVDGLADITNSGTIRGVGIAAPGNTNEALAIGGGTVNNLAGGVISSDQRAITVDDSNLGNAFGAVTINNAGTIRGGNGDAISITSTFNNTLVNSGIIIGNVGTGSGDDTVTINAGSQISGVVNGGAHVIGDTLNYNKVGLTQAKIDALTAGGIANIGGTLYTGFETVNGTVSSFSSFATNGLTQGIAAILDNGSTTQAASPELQALIDQVASSSDVAGALAQLTPAAFQSYSTIGVSSSFQGTGIADQRLNSLRNGGPAFAMSGFDAIAMLADRGDRRLPASMTLADDLALAYADATEGHAAMAQAGGNVFKAPPGLAPESLWGAFIYGNAVFARQDATATAPASKFNSAGVTVGLDRKMNDNFVLGVLAGYSHTDADLDTLGSTSKIDTWLVGAYGSYARQNWFVNGAFIYGSNSYDTNRIALGSSNLSSPDGSQYALQGTFGADFVYGSWIVTPEVGAQYTAVRVDAFTETGPAALSVEADRTESLRSSLGVRLRYDWRTAAGTLMPELRVSWQHEFLDQDRDIRASFVDQALPGTFATTVAGTGSDFGIVGAGLTATVATKTQISLGYDFKFGGDDFSAHQLSGRLRYLF